MDDASTSPFKIFAQATLRGLSFQLMIMSFLALVLYLFHLPKAELLAWILSIVVLNITRYFLVTYCYEKKIYISHPKMVIASITCLFLLLGIIWGSSYFYLYWHTSGLREGLVILTLGGMAAGAIPSLSPYLRMYLAFVIPMLGPVVLINLFRFTPDYLLFGIMVLMFLILMIITAQHYQILMRYTLQQDKKLEELIDDLSRSNKELSDTYLEIQKISRTDALTDLPNRRYFDDTLAREWSRAAREKTELSLIMIDVDNFKVINDELGHLAGDNYLKLTTQILKKNLRRPADFIARIGGDEFAVILPNMGLEQAHLLAEHLRNLIYENNRNLYPKHDISLSLGVSSNMSCDSTQSLLSSADKNLYQAKNKGKNKVFSSPQ